MKRTLALILTFILVCFFTITFLPSTAYAADHTISTGGTYSLDTYGANSSYTINTTETVTFTQTNPYTPFTNVAINCIVSGANIQFDYVNIDNSANDNVCALNFTGLGNTLNLLDTAILKSGQHTSGIQVGGGTELTIKGNGNLEVTGGYFGAGIGSGGDTNCGNINIESGTITATGGGGGAGIGNAFIASGGVIKISGGIVTANGGSTGAGIGSGNRGTGCVIEISGGTITANGGDSSAGIGAGLNGSCETIIISGGDIKATGG